MYQISGIDLHYVVKELQQLVGGRVDKIYQLERKDFLINIHKTGIGKRSIRIKLPDAVYVTEKKHPAPQNPPGYCMFLRKRLDRAKVIEISQIGLERILKIVFEKDEKYTLYAEVFSKGNLVLTDDKNMIIHPLERQVWKDREVASKKDYILPKQRINPIDLDENGLNELLSKTKKDKLVTFLAVELGLGGKYAEIVCGKDKDSVPKEANAGKLIKKIKSIFNEDKQISNEIDEEFEVKIVVEDKQKKAKSIASNQEEHIKKLEEDIVKYKKIGEAIYNNYQFLTKELQEFKKTGKTSGKLLKKEKIIEFDLN